jgi:hypothetical protein
MTGSLVTIEEFHNCKFWRKIFRNSNLKAKRLVVVSYQIGHVASRIYKGKEQ